MTFRAMFLVALLQLAVLVPAEVPYTNQTPDQSTGEGGPYRGVSPPPKAVSLFAGRGSHSCRGEVASN